MDDDLCELSLVELAALIARGETTATSATEAALRRIERLQPSLNAFITVTADRALARAGELDGLQARRRSAGPLHGVPVSVKDNLPLAGVRTTAGSPLLADWIPTTTALAVERLEEAGAIVVGKTNLWEFAYGAPSELFGPAVNPWSPGHSAGASSSGSAVAVAAGLGAVSLGTDSGGSIRIPASFCGVVGLKPTYGLVPTVGVIPVSPTLDHVGVLARSVGDVAAVVAATAGVRRELRRSLAGARIGLLERAVVESLSPEVADLLDAAVELMRASGAAVDELPIPSLDEGFSVKWTISGFEAARYHDQRFGHPSDAYAPGVRRLLERGRAIPTADYERALRRRAELRRELEDALAGVDVLALPATPTPAVALDAQDEDALSATTHFTSLFNVVGSPALVVPAGVTAEGLPVGLQLVGRIGTDAGLLALGAAFEAARGSLPVPPAVRGEEHAGLLEPGRSR